MTPDDAMALAAATAQPPLEPFLAYQTSLECALRERSDTLAAAYAYLATHSAPLARAATTLVQGLRAGHKVLVAGNGGSAAEAQHFAAELVGRFKREREPYAAIALTTDTSILTAIANDYGYEEVFARQLAAFGAEGDLFVGFSTSGESANLMRAFRVARQRGLTTIAVVGARPCSMARMADITLAMPLTDTATVQELHMATTHLLCDVVERELSWRQGVTH